MRGEPLWLSRTLLEAIHTDQIKEHGGEHGLRDASLLESALARARHRFHYVENCDLASLAAAYGYGLARNHAFVDGNKRVAILAMYVFLGLNGQELAADEAEVVRVMLRLASGELSEEDLAAWLRSSIRPGGK